MNTLDAFIAIAQTTREEPYSYELNKIRPKTVAPAFETSKNLADFPNVPEAAQKDVQAFIEDLKKLAQLEVDLKKQEADLRSLMASQVAEKDQLKIKLNEQAQFIGPKIQQIDSSHDTVVAKLQQMFIAASQQATTTGETTIDKDAQIELLKGTMRQVNNHFANEVLARFEASLAQFKVLNTVVKKTLRVFPATQEQMQGKAIKHMAIRVLWSQVKDDLSHLMQDLLDMMTSGLSAMLETETIIQNGISALNPKVLKMPQQEHQLAANLNVETRAELRHLGY